MNNHNWQRVSKRRRCPICDRPDWCLFVGDPSSPAAAICARLESEKRVGEGGWLHVLRDDGPTWTPWRRTFRRAITMMDGATPGGIDFGRLAAGFQAAVRPDALKRLGYSLGLSVASLQRLGVGWAGERRAWTFPMTDRKGKVRGIRLRLSNGRKMAVRSGREGLFIPEGLETGERLMIAEGPTDTAALLDLGFEAVGRPNCTGGLCLLVEAMQQWRPTEVVIAADADGPGQHGAATLAHQAVAYCGVVKIITPPIGAKDARKWKQSGATAADVQRAIDVAEARRLQISTERKAGARCKTATV